MAGWSEVRRSWSRDACWRGSVFWNRGSKGGRGSRSGGRVRGYDEGHGVGVIAC